MHAFWMLILQFQQRTTPRVKIPTKVARSLHDFQTLIRRDLTIFTTPSNEMGGTEKTKKIGVMQHLK